MGAKMKFKKTRLRGVYEIELEPFHDERGLFARTFCQKEFAKIGFHKQIVQINHSITQRRGTIRGMHYQCPPACEIKIIRCIQGKVFDVALDIRAGSSTFMQWHGIEISKGNMRMVHIPEGCAHGFQALTDHAELIYHHSASYSPEHAHGLRFNDPTIAIEWPLPVTNISPKDNEYPLINNDFRGIQI